MDKGTLTRIVVFVLAWVNSFLAQKGFKTIPYIDDKNVATIITLLVSAYTFVKHNFIGKKGQFIKSIIDSLKAQPPTSPVKVEQPVAEAPVQPTEPQQPVQETK